MASPLDDAYVPAVVPAEDVSYFEKSGHGAPVGWGEQPAVVVIDMTEEFTSGEYDVGRSDTGSRAVAAMSEIVDAGREAGVPIIYTKPETTTPAGYPGATTRRRDEDSREQRSRGNTITSELAPAEADVVINKPRASGFFDTHLANLLHYSGVDTLVVGGMTTSGCVRATVVDAHSSNFRVIVPEEGTADRSAISHEVSLFDIDMKYGDVTPASVVVDRLRALETPPSLD